MVKMTGNQPHMKSDDERKKKLDHAIKKKQDKKDGGFDTALLDKSSEETSNLNTDRATHFKHTHVSFSFLLIIA